MISLVLYKFYKCTVSVSEGPTIHYSHARTYLYLTAPDALATAAPASAAAAASLAVLGEKPKEATACVAASASSRRACEMARLFGELARSDESAASGSGVVSSAFRLPTEGNIEISVTRLVAQPTASLTPEICRSNDRPCSPARRPSPWTSRPPSLI